MPGNRRPQFLPSPISLPGLQPLFLRGGYSSHRRPRFGRRRRAEATFYGPTDLAHGQQHNENTRKRWRLLTTSSCNYKWRDKIMKSNTHTSALTYYFAWDDSPAVILFECRILILLAWMGFRLFWRRKKSPLSWILLGPVSGWTWSKLFCLVVMFFSYFNVLKCLRLGSGRRIQQIDTENVSVAGRHLLFVVWATNFRAMVAGWM